MNQMEIHAIAQQKLLLRQEILAMRKAMPFVQRAEADAAICERILAHPAFAAATQIFAYVAMPHEVQTRALLTACLACGKRLALPVCNPQTHTMTFYRLDHMDELQTGVYRIPVPPATPDRICTPDAATLILLPMNAYDGAGYRLGAGGGYYDRYLAAHPTAQTLGICYASCRREALPHDSFDQKIKACVTENETEEFHV